MIASENYVDYTGVYDVTTEWGLLACHNGLNDTAFPGKIQINDNSRDQR